MRFYKSHPKAHNIWGKNAHYRIWKVALHFGTVKLRVQLTLIVTDVVTGGLECLSLAAWIDSMSKIMLILILGSEVFTPS